MYESRALDLYYRHLPRCPAPRLAHGLQVRRLRLEIQQDLETLLLPDAPLATAYTNIPQSSA
jgi:hypothetical protein